ncbi:CBO0543 family protein [Aquibacillus rhizosphaerae]|uniref:CBO0543 family protein n=1 Tax=Aquibacillus rhizosphaerae TaxID=3051431 RepID=A0ABT7L3M4_9BACI|nr:CBO0543 family protein [Aquibacillus sp. LR5S19]MDL4840444.1 CBO0543 family protein [Aquibacillus sp. LR5S19]
MNKEKSMLYSLTFLGLALLPFALNKKPRKDWIIVFLLKTFISGFLGNIVAVRNWIEYPVRLFPKTFQSSVLFENLLFPVMCVFYNRTTYKSSVFGMLYQSIIYSLPMTVIEIILERGTKLITYHKWTWYYTFFSLTGTFLIVRWITGLIRLLTKSEQ